MFRKLLSLGGCLALLTGCSQAAPEAKRKLPYKTYAIHGRHSVFGPYSGQLELRSSTLQGACEVTRAVTFDLHRVEGLAVQEVWSGKGFVDNGKLTASFQLKRAELFTQVDAMRRSDDDFRNPLLVSYKLVLPDGQAQAFTGSGTINDTLTGKVDPSDEFYQDVPNTSPQEKFIWRDERNPILAKGDSFPLVFGEAMGTIFLPVMLSYRFDSFVRQYWGRQEFYWQNQYFILDPTDFNFLRAHPGVVRVVNKVVDFIGLVESAQRTDAYSHNLLKKAMFFDEDMRQNHLNQLGLFAGALYDPAGKRLMYCPNGDGALWSGMYAGAQAMRFLVTKEPQALDNFKQVTGGLMLLMDLPKDKTEFARTAELVTEGELLAEPWRSGGESYPSVKWVYGGNNDMIKGLFHAFVWAFVILSEGDPFLEKVKDHCRRLPNLRIAHEINHPGNQFCALGLQALATGRKEDLEKYFSFYDLVEHPINSLGVNEGFYYEGVGDWSGVNLNMVSQVSEILIANAISARAAESDPGTAGRAAGVVRDLRAKLLSCWSHYAKCRRDFLTIAAQTFSFDHSPYFHLVPGTATSDWPKKELWPTVLSQSSWSLREIPLPRTYHDIAFDYSKRSDWCISSWPHNMWKSLGERAPIEYYYQGAYDYPIFEGEALESDNFWTSAFQIRANCSSANRHGRVDYLHSYWMGRLSGLLQPDS